MDIPNSIPTTRMAEMPLNGVNQRWKFGKTHWPNRCLDDLLENDDLCGNRGATSETTIYDTRLLCHLCAMVVVLSAASDERRLIGIEIAAV